MHEPIHNLLSGEMRGPGALGARIMLRLAETPYAALMRLRNALYAANWKRVHDVGRPVISVGNITAGGVGKTPMVAWLAGALRNRGYRPAILMRGYGAGSNKGAKSDEAAELDAVLDGAKTWRIPVYASPNRVASAANALRNHPEIDLFLLDDGFQHRRVGRAFDLLLIDATAPFGFGHVHPRGLLREPLSGLARASTLVLTRSDLVDDPSIAEIRKTIRQYNAEAPIHTARHAIRGLRSSDLPAADPPDIPIASLANRKIYTVAGIGNPRALGFQLDTLPGNWTARRWFGDHHPYTKNDAVEIAHAAQSSGADYIVVTEKDWTKLSQFAKSPSIDSPKWARLALAVEFEGDAGGALLGQIVERVRASRPPD